MNSDPTLKTVVLIENKFVTLRYYPDCNIIHHTIHKFIFGEELRKLLMKGADLFEQNKCNKWLSDDRKNSALPPEDMEWGRAEWTPRMVKAGWKYWAILMPDKMLGKMTLRRVIAEYEAQGLTVEIFDDVQEALSWLIKQEGE